MHVIALVSMGIACGKESQICHSRQARAKDNLNALNTAEAHFREKTGKFAGSLVELGFTAPEPENYDLKIDSATATTYHATATGKGSAKGDVWTVDQLGNPIVSIDGCK
jgi:S-adenosylmethionine hydrolase